MAGPSTDGVLGGQHGRVSVLPASIPLSFDYRNVVAFMLYGIKIPTDAELAAHHCCKVGCTDPAVWSLVFGPTPDDFTESCQADVAELLGGLPLLGITAIGRPVVDHLDFVIDGAPGAVSGRFVELEGFCGSVAPERIDSVGGPSIEWLQDPNGNWRLRVAILGGALTG